MRSRSVFMFASPKDRPLLSRGGPCVGHVEGRQLFAKARRNAGGPAVLGRERSGDLGSHEQALTARVADLLDPEGSRSTDLTDVRDDLERLAGPGRRQVLDRQ